MKAGSWSEEGLNIISKTIGDTQINVYSDRPLSLGEMLQRTAAQYPDRTALIYDQNSITYGEFSSLANKLSSALQLQHDVQKGDRVAILFTNTIEFCVCFFAVAQIGAICQPLNYRLSPDEMVYQLNDTGASALIFESIYMDQINRFRDRLDSLKKLFIAGDATDKNIPDINELMEWKGKDYLPVEIDEEDVAAIMYTSGTTGKPKGAMLCHRNLICNAMSAAYVMEIESDTKQLILTPLFHASALYSQLMTSVLKGGTIVIMKAFKTRESLELMAREKVNLVIAVPTMYWFWANLEDFDQYDFSSLKYTISGAAPAAPELIKRLSVMFPNSKFINAGGMTEAGSFTFALPPKAALKKLGSIGWSTPCMEIKVARENGEPAVANETGEFLYKGASVFKGYWNMPEATEASFTDGWFHTGDLGKFDDDGYLYIMDRKKDMIIRGGENIYCVELENALYAHPKILEAAVCGVPDKIFGEKVKAVIVPKAGVELTEEEVKSFCKEHLADYKVPEFYAFVKELPRTPTGKVIKSKLKQ